MGKERIIQYTSDGYSEDPSLARPANNATKSAPVGPLKKAVWQKYEE